MDIVLLLNTTLTQHAKYSLVKQELYSSQTLLFYTVTALVPSITVLTFVS